MTPRGLRGTQADPQLIQDYNQVTQDDSRVSQDEPRSTQDDLTVTQNDHKKVNQLII